MENGYRKANRLIEEKSPYLLQHAYNPVDWYPWGDEAFQLAAKEDKPVFLSIGYATCHWCHVMERESFENDETADILNRGFIAIKVDREERPDIDSIYMDALNATGQAGGWPLNMFLTPDKKPFFGGTYFPPVRRYGMNSFSEILETISNAWQTNRTQIIDAAREITQILRDNQKLEPGSGMPSQNCFKQAYGMYNSLYDNIHYGFKTDARNKFPPSMGVSFLIEFSRRTGNTNAFEMAQWTLAAMKRGGIYDQLGGGLCRYSTDHAWLVPHFEKMLYDNSLFLKALAECYQINNNDFYKQAAYDIVSYIERDLGLPEGGIASAEDADSEGEEGKFYLWTREEFKDVTGDQADFLEKLWNVTEQGNFEGKNILNESTGTPPLSHEEKYGQQQADNIKLNRQKLFERRSHRPRPLRDDKVITSWNCLYIRGLVKAAVIFQDDTLLARAKRIEAFLMDFMFNDNGRLLRRYRDNESGVYGYLVDYAELGLACLELFKATSELGYLHKAKRITEQAIALFSSNFGAFYDTGSDSEALLRRTINGYDGVEPSGNSTMAKLLCSLASMGVEEDRYNAAAEGIFKYFWDIIEKVPTACPAMLDAFMTYSYPSTQIVIIADKPAQAVKDNMPLIRRSISSNDIVINIDPNELTDWQSALPIAEGKTKQGEFTAYVCTGHTCKPPVQSIEELVDLLRKEDLLSTEDKEA